MEIIICRANSNFKCLEWKFYNPLLIIPIALVARCYWSIKHDIRWAQLVGIKWFWLQVSILVLFLVTQRLFSPYPFSLFNFRLLCYVVYVWGMLIDFSHWWRACLLNKDPPIFRIPSPLPLRDCFLCREDGKRNSELDVFRVTSRWVTFIDSSEKAGVDNGLCCRNSSLYDVC